MNGKFELRAKSWSRRRKKFSPHTLFSKFYFLYNFIIRTDALTTEPQELWENECKIWTSRKSWLRGEIQPSYTYWIFLRFSRILFLFLDFWVEYLSRNFFLTKCNRSVEKSTWTWTEVRFFVDFVWPCSVERFGHLFRRVYSCQKNSNFSFLRHLLCVDYGFSSFSRFW